MKIGEQKQVEGYHCPSCNKFLDGATPVGHDERSPSEGDFTICFSCGVILRYGKDLKGEVPTEEQIELAKKSGIFETLENIKKQLKLFRLHQEFENRLQNCSHRPIGPGN
jgi:hypothetical protein